MSTKYNQQIDKITVRQFHSQLPKEGIMSYSNSNIFYFYTEKLLKDINFAIVDHLKSRIYETKVLNTLGMCITNLHVCIKI